MTRIFFVLGSAYALVAVALGAFAAHALKAHLAPPALATFETGVRYQMYHALALVATAWAFAMWPSRSVVAAGWLFAGGTLLFAGSLYVLVLTPWRWVGAITPLGGLALIAGWACLLWSAWKSV